MLWGIFFDFKFNVQYIELFINTFCQSRAAQPETRKVYCWSLPKNL